VAASERTAELARERGIPLVELDGSIELDLAIDGGPLTGLPSTVVDLTGFGANGEWSVLREGGMGRSELDERIESVS